MLGENLLLVCSAFGHKAKAVFPDNIEVGCVNLRWYVTSVANKPPVNNVVGTLCSKQGKSNQLFGQIGLRISINPCVSCTSLRMWFYVGNDRKVIFVMYCLVYVIGNFRSYRMLDNVMIH